VICFALACGGSGGSDSTESNSVKFRFKAEPGDQLIAYTLKNDPLFDTAVPSSQSSLDPSTGISQLDLSKGFSYRLRLARQGVQFMDTIVLKDQFLLAQNGILDIGELNGLTTLMTWGAISGAELNGVSAEDAIKQQLSLVSQVSNIQLLSDIKASEVEESVFGKNYIAQMNLSVIFTARSSFAIRDGALNQTQWNAKAQNLNDIYLAIAQNENLAQHTNLRDQYLTLCNTGDQALPLVSLANVTNQMVSSSSVSSEVFLGWAQSTSVTDIDLLMVEMGL
jgi:hypothetical protein